MIFQDLAHFAKMLRQFSDGRPGFIHKLFEKQGIITFD